MSDNQQEERKKAMQKASGMLFTGCMFLGMAAGWYFGDIKIGLFGGMGIGFILMAVALVSSANKR